MAKHVGEKPENHSDDATRVPKEKHRVEATQCTLEAYDATTLIGLRTVVHGAAIEHTEPPPHVHVTVELRADGYRVGKRRVGFDHVVRHLEEAVRTAEKPDLLVFVPVMAADVPVERVMDVFAACLDKGIPRLDFFYRMPRKENRRVDVLRRPERGR